MATLRTTKHLIRLISRTNYCHDLPLFYIGVKHLSTSVPRTYSSHIIRRQSLSLCNEVFCRCYGSDSSLPSHKTVPLPALSPTMERGTIVSWEKKVGDRLNEGDLLAEIETDKATMGFETPEEGYLAKILVPPGSRDVPIGKIVCIIVENEDDIQHFKNYIPDDDAAPVKSSPPSPSAPQESKVSKPPPTPAKEKPVIQKAEIPKPSVVASTSASPGDRVFASPFARKTANEKGIDLKSIGQGSGPDGRIRVEDVINFKGPKIDVSAPTAAFVNVPLTITRQENYQQLLEWKKKVPQYYLTVDIKMDNIIKLKEELNSIMPKDSEKITENDFIIKASALACQTVPEVNSSWQDTHIRRYNTVNINVVFNSDEGVYSPVINAVERKGLASISKELNHLKGKVQQGNLESHDLQGGTFTINNLAMYRVKHFSQIINYPQACSLSIGSMRTQIVPCEKSERDHAVANVICATLSCDHRVVDGAVGAQWLDVFKKLLEKPQLMLM